MQSEKENPHMKGVSKNLVPMFGDCDEMSDCLALHDFAFIIDEILPT